MSIADLLKAGDIEATQAELPRLVGRETSKLDGSGITAAVIESVGKNSVEAVVAPVLWETAAGTPGATACWASGSVDAIVRRRDERCLSCGWTSVRLNDVSRCLPTPLFATLLAVQRPRQARAIWPRPGAMLP